jgi:hypothetical protein
MKTWVSPALLLLMLAATAAESFAANWYVAKGASGSNNGTSWTNAWNEMNQINFSAVACGDTIWLAGGTYTSSLTLNKGCTSGFPLTIRRVLSTDTVPVGTSGWQSSFDSQVTLANGNISAATGSAYIIVDGRLGTVASNNFGISLQETGGNWAISFGSVNANHITFSYVEVNGPACVVSQNCSSDTHALDLRNWSGAVDSITIDHCWLHRESEIVWAGAGASNLTIQYSQLDTSATTNDEHADIMYGAGTMTNFIFRYNRVFASDNDGMLFESGMHISGFYFYGNLYYWSMGPWITFKDSETLTNIYLYNNVFEYSSSFNPPSGNHWASYMDFVTAPSSGAAKNNVFEGGGAGSWGGMTADYNAYSSDVGKGDSGAHSFTYTKGTQFVNVPNGSNPSAADFHLTAAGVTTFGGNGATLSAPYNSDVDGNTCSSSCNVGAYQATSSTSTVSPPSGLTASVQ